jgi:predicted metal-dependent hydrolase
VPALQIGPRLIEYSLASGTSRRYTYFRFSEDLTLEITLPRGRRVDLNSVVRRKQGWILKKYEELSRDRTVLDGESLMFDGERLAMRFEKTREREEILPNRERGVVVVRASEKSRVRELVRRWFLKETSRYVVQKLSDMSEQIHGKCRRADVREIENWGYCTRSGRISFSWQLIALPEKLREYVILHELTHLSEFNHSKEFKRKLETACPDFRQRERELDQVRPFDLQGKVRKKKFLLV